MHAVVYNKSHSLLINPVDRCDSVSVHCLRVPPDCVSWADRTVRYSKCIARSLANTFYLRKRHHKWHTQCSLEQRAFLLHYLCKTPVFLLFLLSECV